MTLSTCAKLSRHAKRRSAQSNLSAGDLELVRRYGVLEHRTGVLFYFVRKRDVERFRLIEPRLPMLQGVVLIMSNDNTIITIYRNSHALKDIRRKTKLKWHVAA